MRLRPQFFLATLLAVLGVALLGLLAQQGLTKRGFADYRRASLQLEARELADEIGQEYQLTGRWRDVLANAWRWPDLSPPRHPPERRPPPRGPGRRGERPPPPSPAGSAYHRFMLLDADRRPLSRGDWQPSQWEPIDAGGETVGWLGFRFDPRITHPLDAQFAQRQRQALLLVALAGLLVAALCAWWLSGRLVRGIRQLLAASRQVAGGDLSLRLPIRSRDELGQLTGQFNAMLQALRDGAAREQRWLADVAHELRTPLAVLRGELEALQDGVRPLNQAAVTSLQDEIRHLESLVDDLHLISAADSQRLALEVSAVQVDEVFTALQAQYGERLQAQGLALQCDTPAGLVLAADDRRLRQVFDNLMQNLLRYATPGAVQLRARREGNAASLVLSDAGPGVPAEARPHLFERLYRVEGSRSREAGGSGLGLAICRSIVQAHGGTIGAHASDAGGLEIRIRWPLHG